MKKIIAIATMMMLVMGTVKAGGNHQAVISKLITQEDGKTSIHYRGHGGTIVYQIDTMVGNRWVPVIKGNGRQDRTSAGTRAITFRLPDTLVGKIRVSIYNNVGELMDSKVMN